MLAVVTVVSLQARQSDSATAVSRPETHAISVTDTSSGENWKYYLPRVEGFFQGRFEQGLEHDEGRFQVRRARLNAVGDIMPSMGYRVQIDLCDRGKITILDVYAVCRPVRGLDLMAGQMLMPMGRSANTAPKNYLFANRDFIGKQMTNFRSVGIKGCYNLVPGLRLDAGFFNATSIADHRVWQKKWAYAARVSFSRGGLALEGGFESTAPYGHRFNTMGAYASWRNSNLLFEAEYARKAYCSSATPACNGVMGAADYGLDLRPTKSFGRRISFQARYDYLGNHSDGSMVADLPALEITDVRRQRVTLGTTFALTHGRATAKMRLNWEQYFYPRSYTVPPGAGSRLIAELVLIF